MGLALHHACSGPGGGRARAGSEVHTSPESPTSQKRRAGNARSSRSMWRGLYACITRARTHVVLRVEVPHTMEPTNE
jgi:hypothetical protein